MHNQFYNSNKIEHCEVDSVLNKWHAFAVHRIIYFDLPLNLYVNLTYEYILSNDANILHLLDHI